MFIIRVRWSREMSQSTVHSGDVNVQASTSSKVFNLKWSTKDNLIQNLNKYTALLHLNQPNEGEKSSVIQETDRLILQISALPIKQANVRKRMRFDSTSELVLELSWRLRDQLIAHLVANKSYAISVDAFSKNEKRNLINLNKQLVFKLVNMDVESDSPESINDNWSNDETQGNYGNNFLLF